MKNRKFETFNDGIVKVLEVNQRSITKELGKLRFGYRTIGIKRFYEAKVLSSSVDKLISIPKNTIVKQMNIIEIESVQYKIEQIQEKFDTAPPCLYLSLKKETIKYTDERI